MSCNGRASCLDDVKDHQIHCCTNHCTYQTVSVAYHVYSDVVNGKCASCWTFELFQWCYFV